MGKHTAAWKAHERRLAGAFGGVRLGATGKENPDVIAGDLRIEAKHRAELPAWLTEPLEKVRAQAGAGRLGLVVWHGKGQRDSVVVLALSDFRDWFGSGNQAGNQAGQDD